MITLRRTLALIPLLALLALPARPAVAQRARGAVEAEARVLHQRGMTHFNLREFDRAIALFQQSYRLARRPRLLFNIAQAYRGLGDCARAFWYYRAYLRHETDPLLRESVEQMVERDCSQVPPAQLEVREGPPAGAARPAPPPAPGAPGAAAGGVRLPRPASRAASQPASVPGRPASAAPASAAPAAAAPAPAPAAPAPARGSADAPATTASAPPADLLLGLELQRLPRALKVAGVVVAAAGVALLATGLYYQTHAAAVAGDVQGTLAAGGAWDERLAAREAEGQRAERLGLALLPVGAATLLAGGALYFVGWREARSTCTAAPLRRGAALSFARRF